MRRSCYVLPDITLDDVSDLAKNSDYGLFAVGYDGTKINWADAAAFFLLGYMHAKRLMHDE